MIRQRLGKVRPLSLTDKSRSPTPGKACELTIHGTFRQEKPAAEFASSVVHACLPRSLDSSSSNAPSTTSPSQPPSALPSQEVWARFPLRLEIHFRRTHNSLLARHRDPLTTPTAGPSTTPTAHRETAHLLETIPSVEARILASAGATVTSAGVTVTSAEATMALAGAAMT